MVEIELIPPPFPPLCIILDELLDHRIVFNKQFFLAQCKETVIPISSTAKSNNVVAILKRLPKEFRIRFSIRLSKELFGLSSVLRFTATDGNKEVFGDRIPAVFFLKVSSFRGVVTGSIG